MPLSEPKWPPMATSHIFFFFVYFSSIGVQEEDILDLLEQCELDDEKLTGKSSRQRGPKVGDRQRKREGERAKV